MARARARDRGELVASASGSTGRSGISIAQPSRKSATCSIRSIGGFARVKRKTSCAKWCAISVHRYGVNMKSFCEDLCMTWDEIADAGARSARHDRRAHRQPCHPQEDIGPRGAVRTGNGTRGDRIRDRRAARNISPIRSATRHRPAEREYRLAQELGFKTATTTNPGVLFPEHADQLMALPRISLNGEYQQMRYVRVLMSGAATAMWNRFGRGKAA